jgi:hypothetical protein
LNYLDRVCRCLLHTAAAVALGSTQRTVSTIAPVPMAYGIRTADYGVILKFEFVIPMRQRLAAAVGWANAGWRFDEIKNVKHHS